MITNKNIVFIDSGLIKYATKSVLLSRLTNAYDEAGILKVMQSPNLRNSMYDITAVSIRNKLTMITKLLGSIDEAYICMDLGKSWRQQVPKTVIPGTDVASSGTYKGSRHIMPDDATLAANAEFAKMFNETINNISRLSNIAKFERYSIEADDFMITLGASLAEYNNVIILSDDYDITQSVKTTDNGFCYVLQWKHGKDTKLVVDHRGFNDSKPNSIFDKPRFSLEMSKIIHEHSLVIAPQYLIMEKIINGDSSDEITPVMVRIVNGRNYKCNRKGFQAIHDYAMSCNNGEPGYLTIENLYDDYFIVKMLDIVHQNVHKSSMLDLPDEWQDFYVNKFKENRKLVAVNKKELGDVIYRQIINDYECIAKLTPIINLPNSAILSKL